MVTDRPGLDDTATAAAGSSFSGARARLAAHISWAHTEDRSARTAPARAALEAKFLTAADGDPIRAEHLRKAYYTRLAMASAAARRSKGGKR